MRKKQFQEAGYCLTHSFYIARIQMRAEREIAIDVFAEISLPKLTKRFRQIVDNEAVTIREKLDPHFWNFPAGNVKVNSIKKRHIFPDHIRHGREEMAASHHYFDWLVSIAEEGERRMSRERFFTASKGSRFTIRLERCDNFLRHRLQVRNFIKPNCVPQPDQPHLA